MNNLNYRTKPRHPSSLSSHDFNPISILPSRTHIETNWMEMEFGYKKNGEFIFNNLYLKGKNRTANNLIR